MMRTSGEQAVIASQALHVESSDLNKLRDAFNLVGGERSREVFVGELGKTSTHPDHKCFSHIFSNSFTLMNVREAVDFIKLRHIELYDLAEQTGAIVPLMADGIRANADHAVLLAEEFSDHLTSMIAKEKGPERSLRSILERL